MANPLSGDAYGWCDTNKRQKVDVMGAVGSTFVFYGAFEGGLGGWGLCYGLFRRWPRASQDSPEAWLTRWKLCCSSSCSSLCFACHHAFFINHLVFWRNSTFDPEAAKSKDWLQSLAWSVSLPSLALRSNNGPIIPSVVPNCDLNARPDAVRPSLLLNNMTVKDADDLWLQPLSNKDGCVLYMCQLELVLMIGGFIFASNLYLLPA